MNKEIQDNFKDLIHIYTYDRNVFRFCFFGQEEVISSPMQSSKQIMNVIKDAENKLQSKKRYFHFIFDPPTRNIRFDFENKLFFTGIVNTIEDQNFLKLYLYDDINIYGLGAINGSYQKINDRYILRNIDTFFYTIKNQPYASFPFLFFRKKNSEKHFAILFYTSYPLEISIKTNKNSPYKCEIDCNYYHKRESKEVDFFLFFGTPEEIYKNYIKLIGYPFLPPLWSLGYHQSRWSYKNQKRVKQIVQRAKSYNIPLDAIYLDIHYMNRYKVFTWNPKRFPDPKKLIEYLHPAGIKLVVIVDPGIAIDEDYEVYKEGIENNFFCKNSKNDFFIGKVWPGKVHFPDFTKEKVREWWSKLVQSFLMIGVDGIWNDMNEPTLYMGKTDEPLNYDIQFESHNHLKIRNIYANLEAEATFKSFEKLKKRPFILSRSGSIGLQKYSALWTGDNHTTWKDLRENLYMVINLNLSGMFFCGADVGGFGSPFKGLFSLFKFFKNSELFERWIELGSLLPLFRNHTTLFSYNQEPWSFGNQTLLRVKKHIRRRYQLILYLYYLFYLAHKEGIPIVRPLFYHYGSLPIEDQEVQNQFLLGNHLMACPVLYPSLENLRVFLPPGNWYDFETGISYSGNRWLTIKINRGYYPLLVKSGAALPISHTGNNAEDSLKNEIFIEIYPDKKIEGNLYLDDGNSNNYGSYYLAKIHGEQINENDLNIQYEILSNTFIPYQKSIKLRLPKNFTTCYFKKKKKLGIPRDLFNEDRNFSLFEYEFPINENWEAKFTKE
ncbi:MAG: TIM-barrel domain-containing protein [Leptonema sp. (in: bacteria)]